MLKTRKRIVGLLLTLGLVGGAVAVPVMTLASGGTSAAVPATYYHE